MANGKLFPKDSHFVTTPINSRGKIGRKISLERLAKCSPAAKFSLGNKSLMDRLDRSRCEDV